MYTKILASLVFGAGLVLTGCSENMASEKKEVLDLCDYMTQDCDGKIISIEGKKAEITMQHPIITFEKKQSYFDTNIGQILVISEKDIACNTVQITGIMQKNVGPCDTQSAGKDSYCGIAIDAQDWKC